MRILTGHTSPQTAYVVNDYPYGFRLRCKIRYWIEYKPVFGFRLVSQTTNPKRPGEIWNTPKASGYARFGMAMFLDENDHVQQTGLSEYSSGEEACAWAEKYIIGVPEIARELTKRWIAAKVAYDKVHQKGDPLNVGLPEADAAFAKTPT